MPTNYRGLAFLLSLGSLPLACGKDDNESDTTTPGTNPTGNTGTDSGTTDGSVTTSTTDPTNAGTTTDPATDTTAAPTTGPLDTGATEPQMTTFLTTNTETGFDTGDTDAPPPATDPVCIAYGAHIVECFPMYARYQEYIAQQCEYYKAYGLRADGQPCADAFDTLYVCLSQVDCAAFENPDMDPCMAEGAAISTACPSLGGGETDTSGTGGSGTSTG